MPQSEILELIRKRFPAVNEEPLTQAVVVPKKLLLEVAGYLKNSELNFDNLHCVTAVDWPERIEVVYILYSLKKRHQIILKVYLAKDDLAVESLTKLYRSADWFEREAYDMFGVKFINHPDLRRILNPSDWQGYPLRKDYSHPGMIPKPRY